MGHENGRQAKPRLDLAQLDLHRGAQVAVQRRERLVQQQYARTDHERAGQGHALLLATGQLFGAAVCEILQLDQRQRIAHAGLDLGLGNAAGAHAVSHVLRHRHMREQGIVLKHDADLSTVRRHLGDQIAVDEKLSLIGLQKARNQVQKRGLAAAGRAQQGQELSLADLQPDGLQRGGLAEGLGDTVDLDGGVIPVRVRSIKVHLTGH